MSQRTLIGSARPALMRPMVGRDPEEELRASTPLELLFDLCFVVAVAFASEELHHAVARGLDVGTMVNYVIVFFGIWWAWVNFTWFASAYDTDDIAYRLSVFVMMVGALVLAAGVPRAFGELDFRVIVVGYVIMRIALVTQWLRVIRHDPPHRAAAIRYVIGVTACQLGWLVAAFLVPGWGLSVWFALAAAEILVPVWAEHASRTSWHPEHIAERYGLFMIIVLGEAVIAASLAIRAVTDGEATLTAPLLTVIAGGLLVVFSAWWLYFDRPEEHLLDSLSTAIPWSYLHLPIFAAVGAVGAGLVVAVEEAGGPSGISMRTVGLAVAIPIAVYIMSVWAIYLPVRTSWLYRAVHPIGVALVLAAALTPIPVLAIGLTMAGLAATKAWLKAHGYAGAFALGVEGHAA
jgi:low temperature requirement protein LtrA